MMHPAWLVGVRAVAFDLDGTLVDSLQDLVAAANALRQAWQCPPLSMPRIASFVGDGMAALVARVVCDDPEGQLDTVTLEQATAVFRMYYATHLSRHSQVYPEVLAGLAMLRQASLSLAVVTNKPAQFSEPLLAQLGLLSWFNYCLSGDSLPEKKPSPLPLLTLCERWGLMPTQILMVGDSRNDVQAARAAGCPVVVVPYGYSHCPAEQLGADAVLPSVQRLAQLYLGIGDGMA